MFRVLVSLVFILSACPIVVSATTVDPVTVSLDKDSGWKEFRFDLNDRDGVWLDPDADPEKQPLGALSFHVVLTDTATLEVTDAFRWGDVFRVLANGTELGSTSDPEETEYTGDDYFRDYDAAFNDIRWSSGSWNLGPGEYFITGYVTTSELRGRGALRLIDFEQSSTGAFIEQTETPNTTPVPLPGSLSLMLGAGAIAASISRRRSNTTKRFR